MTASRRHFTAQEKVAVLRRHLLEKTPVSDLCYQLGINPTLFYRWQKEFFENGAAAFQARERPHRQVEEKQKRIEFLEKKVRTKDEVLAEAGLDPMAFMMADRDSNGRLSASEQLAAFQAVIEARLALPFATVVLGIPVTVTAIQDRPGSGIAVRCRCSS